MKVLRLRYEHLRMFENGILSMDFFAQDKVAALDGSVTELSRPLYTNNVTAIAGVNAAGKTVALRLIDLALRIVEGVPLTPERTLRSSRAMADLFDGDATLSVLLWRDDGLYFYRATIHAGGSPAFVGTGLAPEPVFGDEELRFVSGKITTKAELAADDEELMRQSRLVISRSGLDEAERRFLREDVSILSSFGNTVPGHTLIGAGELPFALDDSLGDGLDSVLRTFDPAIEHLAVEDAGRAFRLKMSTNDDPLTLSREGLEGMLSSGTAKGVMVIQRAIAVLKSGGWMLFDEIENHLNRQLVNVVIDLFASPQTNPNGAQLVFTTHYPEVLDHVHRKDCVYFLARNADSRSSVVKYSTRVKRIENKKSEVFASNFVKGTAPRYSDVAALREFACNAISGRPHE